LAAGWSGGSPRRGIAGPLNSPSGRIGICVSVAANDARGAASTKVMVDPDAVTLTPWSAVARFGSLARGASANLAVAMTSSAVIGVPSDHSRPGRSTSVYASPLGLTDHLPARSPVGYPLLLSLSKER